MSEPTINERALFSAWQDGKSTTESERVKWLMRALASEAMLVTGEVLELTLADDGGMPYVAGQYQIDVLPGTQCAGCVGYRIRFKRVGMVSPWEYLEGDILGFKLVEPIRLTAGAVFHKGERE